MADNTQLNPGASGDVISTEDLGGGVKIQRVKLALGAHGTDGGDAAPTNPLPVGDFHRLVPERFDHVALSYSGAQLTQAVYRQGGPSGAVVATVDLVYAGAQLISATRS